MESEIVLNPLRIFLSYGHDSNAALVEKIKTDLSKPENGGHYVWIDTSEIKFGDDWRRKITDGIHDSQWVFSFLSKHSVRDPGVCRDELAIALGERSGIVHTVLLESEKEVSPPVSVSHIQWLDMHEWKQWKAKGDAPFEAWYRDKFKEILRVIRENISFAGEIEVLKTYLKPLSSEGRIGGLLKQGFTGRAWLIRDIENWRQESQSSQMFFITGEPGIGKSAMAAWLAHVGKANVIAAQFIEHNKADRKDPTRIIRSIAFQIATRLPDYRRALLGLQELDRLDQRDAAELFAYLLREPLANRIGGQRDRYLVVIDALDEASKDGRNALVELLVEVRSSLPNWIGLIVTSRPEPTILRDLSGFMPVELDANDQRNLEDVREFLLTWLKGYGISIRLDAIIDSVLKSSEGNFLYVREFCDAVVKGWIDLNEPDAYPQGMTGIYQLFFKRHFSDLENYKKVVRPLLELVACSQEPLSERLATQILSWDDYARDEAIQSLGSLFPLVGHSIVPFHKSVIDWLVDERKSGSYHSSEKAGHRRFANALWAQYMTGAQTMDDYGLKFLPEHLLLAGQHEQYTESLTDFDLAMTRCKAGLLNFMQQDYLASLKIVGSKDLAVWSEFFVKNYHLLKHGDEQWPSYKILLQRAVDHADDSAVTKEAERWLEEDHCDWLWLRSFPRPKEIVIDPLIMVMTGHTEIVWDAKILPDGRILSFSEDCTLRLWDAQTGRELTVMIGHTDGVIGAAIMPDGRILSWSRDHTLRLWDGKNGKELSVLTGHTDSVSDAKMLDDGRILSWAFDHTLRLWDGQTGKELAVMIRQTDDIQGAKILQDGRTLSWSLDHTLRLWNGQTGKELAVMTGHTGFIQGAKILEDGRLLSWSKDQTLRLWDGPTGNELAVMIGHTDDIQDAKILPDRRIVSWSWDNILRLWDGQTGKELAVMKGHTGSIQGATILEDGRLLSWSWDHTLRLWDGQTGKELAVMTGHTGFIQGAKVLPDGRILSWSWDWTLRLWEGQTGSGLAVMMGHTSYIQGAEILPDGRILSWSMDHTLRMWDSRIGKCLVEKMGQFRDIQGATSLPDGRILSWSKDHTLRLWDSQAGKELAVMLGHTSFVLGAKLSLDNRILSWSADHTLRMWDSQTGKELAVMIGHTHSVRGVAILPDGRILSWPMVYDYILRLWDGQTGKELAVMTGHTSNINGAKILDDGRILSWSADHTLRMWDGKTGKELAVMIGHTGNIQGAEILPDGRILSWAISYDYILHLWDSQTGKELAVMTGHTGDIQGAKILDDGRILSWSLDHTLRLWDGQTGKELAVMTGHKGDIQGVEILSDGRILSWSWDHTLRLWDGQTGKELTVMRGHKGFIQGAKILPDGRILSWDMYQILRLWDINTSECLYSSASFPNTASLLLLKNNEALVVEDINVVVYPFTDRKAPLLVKWFANGAIRSVSVMANSHMSLFVHGNLLRLALFNGSNAVV